MTEQAKLDRLDEYLATNDLASVWFATPPMFAWLTGGSNLIVREGTAGIAAAGYDGEEVTVITSNIEGHRLLDEEIDADVTLVEHPWYESGVADAVSAFAPTPAAADFTCSDFDRIDRSALTQPLTDDDVERYRTLSRETAAAVEEVARDVAPSDTEREVAARLHHALQRRGIESSVALVGGEDRIQRYRHFTPTDTEVGGYAVLTVVGVRRGLNAAVTRTVAFDAAPDWLEERYEDVSKIAATEAVTTRRTGATVAPPATCSRRFRRRTKNWAIRPSGRITIRAVHSATRRGSGSRPRATRRPSNCRWPTAGIPLSKAPNPRTRSS
nr:M24 family metallopeptidase [Halorubrum sp. CBA1125]